MNLRHALQAMRAIVMRELMKFARQYGRLVSALVRPLLWLAVFAAGFRNVFGVAIVEPYDTYIPYDVYIAPGLVGMVLLFNGMQSSLAMVYDREMGLMRLLLTAPLPRPWILLSHRPPLPRPGIGHPRIGGGPGALPLPIRRGPLVAGPALRRHGAEAGRTRSYGCVPQRVLDVARGTPLWRRRTHRGATESG